LDVLFVLEFSREELSEGVRAPRYTYKIDKC
jgi:hypothetical protein